VKTTEREKTLTLGLELDGGTKRGRRGRAEAGMGVPFGRLLPEVDTYTYREGRRIERLARAWTELLRLGDFQAISWKKKGVV
jgi:hypothetical protein